MLVEVTLNEFRNLALFVTIVTLTLSSFIGIIASQIFIAK